MGFVVFFGLMSGLMLFWSGGFCCYGNFCFGFLSVVLELWKESCFFLLCGSFFLGVFFELGEFVVGLSSGERLSLRSFLVLEYNNDLVEELCLILLFVFSLVFVLDVLDVE